jgi:hypothetical protein
VIPDGIITIPAAQFAGCNTLISVFISASVVSIGISAFASCDNLEIVTLLRTALAGPSAPMLSPSTRITIPASVKTIGSHTSPGV